MLKYKLQIFNDNGTEILALESGASKPISLNSDFKGDTTITFGFITKTVQEWIDFFKDIKNAG